MGEWLYLGLPTGDNCLIRLPNIDPIVLTIGFLKNFKSLILGDCLRVKTLIRCEQA